MKVYREQDNQITDINRGLIHLPKPCTGLQFNQFTEELFNLPIKNCDILYTVISFILIPMKFTDPPLIYQYLSVSALQIQATHCTYLTMTHFIIQFTCLSLG